MAQDVNSLFTIHYSKFTILLLGWISDRQSATTSHHSIKQSDGDL